MTAESEILALNEAYVRASLGGDVAWYREHFSHVSGKSYDWLRRTLV